MRTNTYINAESFSIRIKLFILAITILVNTNMRAQQIGFCATPSDLPNFLSTISANQLKAANASYSIGIFFHVMRRSDGSGGQTPQEVNTSFNTLVADYMPYNISFSLLGTDEIKNDTYYNKSDFSADQNGHTDLNGDGKFDVFSINSHSNAIDIYLFANDKLNFGLSANIPGTALVIGGNAYNTNLASSHVLSHEVGHCLGLFHTFHGTYVFEAPPGSCMELVDGSNGNSCGDFVQDTPADPAHIFDCGTQSTCTWNCSNSYIDANGTHYSPNTHLFMSYTFPDCMNLHTSGQVARIFSTIANSCLLQNTLSTYYISGSTTICSSGTTLTVNNVPSGSNVIWSMSSNISASTLSGNPKVFVASGSGTGWVQASINSTSCVINLANYPVWLGKPSFSTYVNGPSQLTPGLSAVYSIIPAAGAATYSWQIPSGCYYNYCWHITSGQGTTAIAVQAGAIGSGAIQVTASNACPGNDSRYMYVTVQDPSDPCDNLALSITPNPSLGGDVVIDVIQPPCDPTLMSSTPATLSVIDNMGTVVYSKKHTGKKIEIKGLRLTKGLYHVVYIKDNRMFEKSMIVE